MISVTTYTSPSTDKLRRMPNFINRLLDETVSDLVSYGDTYMTERVPVNSGRLASAVKHTESKRIGFGEYVGSVYVDDAIAPHAEFVDKGTGVDGPFRMPVSVLGKTNSRGRQKAMRFVIDGRVLFRHTVKARSSEKIKRSMGYSEDTFESMKYWSRIHTTVLARKIRLYLVR